MTIYGYARVSTQDQDFKSQQTTLIEAGAETVFCEKQSGTKADRAQLRATLNALEPGDTLLVTRLDRLARSTVDLLTIATTIADKGAFMRSLAEPWADTTTPAGKMVMTVFAGIAEFERSLIVERTSAGRERAKAQGVRFGKPPALSPKQAAEAVRLSEEQGNQYAADVMGVSLSTIKRTRREHRDRSHQLQ